MSSYLPPVPHASAQCALILVLVAVVAMPSTAQQTEYGPIITQAIKAGVPGIQAYVRRGTDIWQQAAGLSTVEPAFPMRPSDRMRLASITKMFTYAATMELVRRGSFQVTDRAVDLLPHGVLHGIPYAGDITVGQLLSHMSGLYNFNGSNADDFFVDLFRDSTTGARRRTGLQLLAYARDPKHAPTGKPGQSTSYSSTGYIVLQMILEHTERAPIDRIYRDLIFRPLRMTTAAVEGAPLTTAEITPSYAKPSASDMASRSPFGDRKPVRNDGLIDLTSGLRYYNAWAQGAGAVAANAADLGKFMDAVVDGRMVVIDDQAKAFAASRQRPRSTFRWNGGSWGIQASIVYAPFDDVVVIVLMNATNAGGASGEVAESLLAAARHNQKQ